MMKILLFSLLLAFTAYGQTSKIVGSWLMTKAEIKGKTEHPYQVFDFKENAKLSAMGIEVASWKYNKKDHSIIMKSTMDKDFNGVGKISKLTKTSLVMRKDGMTFYYSKLNPEHVSRDNKESGLAGKWEIEDDEYQSSLLKFELPDSFTLIQSGDGMTSTYRGTWIYQPKKESLIMIGFFQEHPLRGKNTVQKLSEEKLVLKNGPNTINAKRIKETKQQIERLTFTEEEFPEEQPTDGPKPPWQDFYAMVDFLQHVQELQYSYGELVPEMKTLKHPYAIVSKLTVKPEKPSVRFTNLSVTQKDSNQFSEDYRDELTRGYDQFFPQKELWPFRIKGSETLTVAAGTFNCTVVEGFDGDAKVKYWMITDMPGIYAKIIREETDPFGKLEYKLYELEEIRKK